jgi:hypothetical protein
VTNSLLHSEGVLTLLGLRENKIQNSQNRNDKSFFFSYLTIEHYDTRTWYTSFHRRIRCVLTYTLRSGSLRAVHCYVKSRQMVDHQDNMDHDPLRHRTCRKLDHSRFRRHWARHCGCTFTVARVHPRKHCWMDPDRIRSHLRNLGPSTCISE